jgi:hypothetical protein
MKTNRRRAGRGCAGAAALILLLGGSGAATGQEGVVIEVTTTSAEEMIPLEAALGEQLGGKDGIRKLDDMVAPFGAALDFLLGGALSSSKVVGGFGDALDGRAPPDVTRTSYTVYLRDRLMAVAAAGYPVMVWEVVDDGRSAMWFLDPGTGRPITIPGTAWSAAIDLQAFDEPGASGVTADVSKPVATGRTREMLGYTAREYSYKVSLHRTFRVGQPGGYDDPFVSIRLDIEGEAWVAPDSPFRDQVAAFYRTFAAGVGDQGADRAGHLSGLTAHMAEIAALGVPLQTSESTTTYLWGPGGPDTSLGAPLSKAATTSIVTAIRAAPIDDKTFYGDGEETAEQAGPGAGNKQAPAPQQTPCDCSCASYTRLQEISRMSKEKQRTDPLAMSAAMCAPQCAVTWIACKG